MNSTQPGARLMDILGLGRGEAVYSPTRSSRVTADQVALAQVAELVQ